MFVISQTLTYTWPVHVEIPTSGGRFEKQSFDAEFKRIPQSKLRALLADEGMTDAAFCREVFVGWKGVIDGNKQDVPFSETARDQLLDVPLVAASVAAAFVESQSGAKRKN